MSPEKKREIKDNVIKVLQGLSITQADELVLDVMRELKNRTIVAGVFEQKSN